MNRLELEKRSALSRAIRDGRDRKGWSQEQAAEGATVALRNAAQSGEEYGVSDEERDLWPRIEVTRHHVLTLENCPAAPIATVERRSRLLGLILALGLDRGEINRLAGGL